jgi:hypothetical protein
MSQNQLFVESIQDKKNGHYLYVTGSNNPGSLPFLQSGLNNFNSGINFIRIRSTGSTDRSSLAGTGLVLNINEPIDLFFVMRFGQNLPNPFSNGRVYMNWGIILSGSGLIGTPIPNQAELTSAYQFSLNTSGRMTFLLATRNALAPHFLVDFNNVFNTGSFCILNWIYNGNRADLAAGPGVGTISQAFLFNGAPGSLSSYPLSNIPTGVNQLETIGYTGRAAFGYINSNDNVAQDYFLGERLIFNKVLSPSERQFVFNYLSGKWGVK